MSKNCFHCEEKVPLDDPYQITYKEKRYSVCCPGCLSVFNTIIDSAFSDYYEHRTGKSSRPIVPEFLHHFSAYDLPEIQEDFVLSHPHYKESTLSIDGIYCAACAWLIEKHIRQLSGIKRITVNTTTNRVYLIWDQNQIPLSTILYEIAKIGYQALPFSQDEMEKKYEKENEKYILRIGIAGLAMMQVMMIAICLYLGYFQNLSGEHQHYLRIVSLLFSTPVALYSAQPFYTNALRSVFNLQISMDVPVSIAILWAYFASVKAVYTHTGEIYFDSVTMFTFFLLISRAFEQKARLKSIEILANLQKLLPNTATIIINGQEKNISSKQIKKGDHLKIMPGEKISADGIIIDGDTCINESMLTGESTPIHKKKQDPVYAGSLNINNHVIIQVNKDKCDYQINRLIYIQEQATMQKPRIAALADSVARYFVPSILFLAMITYIAWYYINVEQAFWITLSVLVATCPCALSLATPTAITCCMNKMLQQGLLVRTPQILEQLPKINVFLFDKTGTLTEGQCTISDIKEYNSDVLQSTALSYMSAIESHSSHPIALAFKPYYDEKITAQNVKNHINNGVSGEIDNVPYYIGHGEFCHLKDYEKDRIYFCKDSTLILSIRISDLIRKTAQSTIQALQQKNIQCQMITGDPNPEALNIAKKLNITHVQYHCNPEQKLSHLLTLQKNNKIVAMCGDGINDSPILSAANVSIAMGSGTDLAKCCTDIVLLKNNLYAIIDGIQITNKMNKIIKQNLSFSLLYNLFIVPLAMSGHIAPYIAVIGMSFSSLFVVSNSLRLIK